MPSLCLSMIVKNEERYLLDCLESVKGVVDEIVIVDTGSTDNTIKIANRYDAKIFSFDWTNDFSAARNFALSKSKSDWILYLDADERLNKKSITELKSKISSNENFGINCVINNLDDRNKTPKLMKYIRLFKNSSEIKFSGKAHEQIEPSLFSQNYKIIDSDVEIIHHGYNVSEEELKIKANRNLELLLSEYNDKPSSYLAYQIANSYNILEDQESSTQYFRVALSDNNLGRELKSVCYLHLADYEMRSNNIEEAKQLVDFGLRIDKSHALLNMIAAQVYDKYEDQKSAFSYCKMAYKLNSEIKRDHKSNNVLDIIIDNKKIIYEGLLLSSKYQNQDEQNYYLGELKREDNKSYINIDKVINNLLLTDESVSELISFIDKDNFEIILKLLKVNRNNNSKLIVLSSIYDQFSKEPFYLLNFGSFLLNSNQLEEAKIIFESAIELENCDDSVFFYLASIYTSTNRIEQLLELLQKAEKRAKKDAFFKSKLDMLLVKLQPILS